MIKKIFLMFIALQALFIGQCYASLDRLADIGAEVLRERIVGSTAFGYSNESRGWIYKGEVYSENMHRKVYLSYWEENNGASVHIIDRISLTDRDIMARAN